MINAFLRLGVAGRTLNFLISAALLTFGFFLYVVYRPYNPHVIWVNSLFNFSDIQYEAPYWVIYNLPGGAWCASGAILINAFKKVSVFTKKELIWSTSILLCGLLMEFLQKMGEVSGTFDIGDIMFLFLGYCFALFYQIFYL